MNDAVRGGTQAGRLPGAENAVKRRSASIGACPLSESDPYRRTLASLHLSTARDCTVREPVPPVARLLPPWEIAPAPSVELTQGGDT